MPKIQAENYCGNLLQKIAAENCCGKLLQIHRICAPSKIHAYDRTMADVKISAPMKISVPGKISTPGKIRAEKFGALLLFGLGRISNC
jgi:hypothetical protein